MAINSSSIVPTSKLKNDRDLVSEKIDERILEILNILPEDELTYREYIAHLKEVMIASRMSESKYTTEEQELITNEYKRVKSNKPEERFKAKKITAESFKKGTAVGVNLGKQKALSGIKPLALPSKVDKISGGDDLTEIVNLLGQIIKNLTQQNKAQKDSTERSRKEAENAKRALAESKLEKGFKLAIKAAEKVIAPVKSLLSRIIDFFMAIFWGKVFLKLLDWFADPANKKKIDSLFRFLGDHWPKLLALYLRFGTGLGKFVGGFTKLVFFGTRKLLQVVAKMLGAKAAARFLGGRGGKLVTAGLQIATTVGTTMALSGGIEKFVGNEKGEKPKTPTPSGGEEFKIPEYSGGGLQNLKNMFGGLRSSFSGLVKGKKGIDQIPAWLSDGEFVVSSGAVQKYGVDTFEAMNAAGGGTNKPTFKKDGVYAAGGGMIGGSPDFWRIAALASKEDGANPQGQADVAQSIYNRVVVGSYPGGKNISDIISASGQYEPTFSNPSKWKFIKDRKSAIDAAGNAQKVDMAAKSISNPTLRREASRFIGGRTDFQGERQKKYMKPGDVTRGSGHNFFGWFYDARLSNPAPVPKSVKLESTQPTTTRTKESDKKRQPNFVEKVKNFIFPSTQSKEPRYESGGMVSLPQIKEPKYESGGIVSLPQIKEPRYESGGISGSPVKLAKAPSKLKNISPPSRPPMIVTTFNGNKTANVPVPSTPGAPKVPSFGTKHPDSTSYIRRLKISGIA